MTVLGSTLFFPATATGPGRGGYNYELWSSDGTAPGTHPVKDIIPRSSYPY